MDRPRQEAKNKTIRDMNDEEQWKRRLPGSIEYLHDISVRSLPIQAHSVVYQSGISVNKRYIGS